MTGKKVFTGAGEFLASFLLELKNEETENQILTNTLDEINGTINTSVTSAFTAYQDYKRLSREESAAFVKSSIRKMEYNTKVTNGSKEYSVQELTQINFNKLEYLKISTNAMFESLYEATFTQIADIFKKIAVNYRAYVIKTNALSKAISEIPYMALDDFLGDVADRNRIFYRFVGGVLKVCDGSGGTGEDVFHEIFRVTTKPYVANQAYLGDEIVIGSASESTITKIRFTKEVISDGNITMANGKELIGTALKARYADLAEYYTSNYNYPAGTLLQIDRNNGNEVTIYDPTDPENYSNCVGVVSDKPGFILNSEMISEFALVPVVLTGRSPIRIVGNVSKGDFIYPHRTNPGIAIAVKPIDAYNYESSLRGQYIIPQKLGIALESKPSSANGQNEFLINVKIN